jgi:DNA repair protein RecN (Recombination protein N)
VLSADDRVRELARMLAGLEGSESAAAHAQELLDLASADRDTADRDAADREAVRRPTRPPRKAR